MFRATGIFSSPWASSILMSFIAAKPPEQEFIFLKRPGIGRILNSWSPVHSRGWDGRRLLPGFTCRRETAASAASIVQHFAEKRFRHKVRTRTGSQVTARGRSFMARKLISYNHAERSLTVAWFLVKAGGSKMIKSWGGRRPRPVLAAGRIRWRPPKEIRFSSPLSRAFSVAARMASAEISTACSAGSAAARRIEGERPCVGEAVQHMPACCQAGNRRWLYFLIRRK